MRSLTQACEHWPLQQTFTIARGSKTEAVTIRVQITEDGYIGCGECVPYAHYGETTASVMAQIEALRVFIEQGGSRSDLQSIIGAGAARNAIDCALWDLASKQAGQRVWTLAGIPAPLPVNCAYTLSLDTAVNMARAARANRHRPLLKIKLGPEQPLACVEAIRDQAPEPGLIIDANESWNQSLLDQLQQPFYDLGVSLLEQPLPAGDDTSLANIPHLIAIAADESCHTRDDLENVVGRYNVINIKLDKCGGLTEALLLREQALARGLGIMVGCMVGTSLAMAPAMLLTANAEIVDLDGPLLLHHDRQPGLEYSDHQISAPVAGLWG